MITASHCCHVLLLTVCIAQNAACVALFPVPVPLPGFYSTSLTQFSSCVPASACLGVDVQRVTASFSSLLLGGVEELRQVGGRLVLHVQEPRVSESSLNADLVTLPCPHEQVDALYQHFFAAALGQPANGTIDNSSVGRQTFVIPICAALAAGPHTPNMNHIVQCAAFWLTLPVRFSRFLE